MQTDAYRNSYYAAWLCVIDVIVAIDAIAVCTHTHERLRALSSALVSIITTNSQLAIRNQVV